jgi:hypothetical protein
MCIGNITNLSLISDAVSESNEINELNDVFKRMFENKSIISFGSFIRKINVIMVNLCNVVDDLWVVVIKFDDKARKFSFVIKAVSKGIIYEVVCALDAGVNFDNSMLMVHRSFNRDKIAKHPVSYLKAKIFSTVDTFILKKSCLNNECIAEWNMCKVKRPWYKRLFGTPRSVLKDIVIVNSEVLEYKL